MPVLVGETPNRLGDILGVVSEEVSIEKACQFAVVPLIELIESFNITISRELNHKLFIVVVSHRRRLQMLTDQFVDDFH